MTVDKMTVVYRKKDGEIKSIAETEQTKEILWGDQVDEYSLVYDILIVDYDQNLYSYGHLLSVVDGKLKIKDSETLQNYM